MPNVIKHHNDVINKSKQSFDKDDHYKNKFNYSKAKLDDFAFFRYCNTVGKNFTNRVVQTSNISHDTQNCNHVGKNKNKHTKNVSHLNCIEAKNFTDSIANNLIFSFSNASLLENFNSDYQGCFTHKASFFRDGSRPC